jgi:hypothetical protein
MNTEMNEAMEAMVKDVAEFYKGESLTHVAAMAFAPLEALDKEVREKVAAEKPIAGLAFGLATATNLGVLEGRTDLLKDFISEVVSRLEAIEKEHRKLVQTIDILCGDGK